MKKKKSKKIKINRNKKNQELGQTKNSAKLVLFVFGIGPIIGIAIFLYSNSRNLTSYMSLELLFVLGGVMLGFIIDRLILNNKKSSVLNKAESFLDNAKRDASDIVKKAKHQANKLENDAVINQ